MTEQENKTNWFSVFSYIKRHGISFAMLSAQIGIPRASLHFYKSGGEPKHKDGEKLIDFWCVLLTKNRDQLPLEKVIYSAAKAKQ